MYAVKKNKNKKQKTKNTYSTHLPQYCSSCPMLALKLSDQMTDWSGEWWLSFIVHCFALPALTGVPGWKGGGRSWLLLLATSWEAEPAVNQAAVGILTMWSGSFQSLEQLCDVSWQQAFARCQLILVHRRAKESALLWPTRKVWSKKLWLRYHCCLCPRRFALSNQIDHQCHWI